MFLSLDICLQSKINFGNLLPLNAKSSSTDALVAKLPFFVFFKLAIFSSLYIISPSCLVDPILNSFFEILKISSSNFFILLPNFFERIDKNL